MSENLSFEDLSFPREVIFQIKWMNGKYKDYRKIVNDIRHLDNCQNFYESRGGKCYGVLDVETILNRKPDEGNHDRPQ